MRFLRASSVALFLVSTAVDAAMVTSSPHPMMRGVEDVDFQVTILGTGLAKTEQVWFFRTGPLRSWQAEIVGTPTDTEFVIRLPRDFPLPPSGSAETIRFCRYERSDSQSWIEECATTGVSGDQATVSPPLLVQTVSMPGLLNLAFCDDILYALTSGNLQILDNSDDTGPVLLSSTNLGGSLSGLVPLGPLLATLRNSSELLLIDVRDPGSPFIRAVVPFDLKAQSLAGLGHYLLIVLAEEHDASELAIVDVSAQPRPTIVNVLSRVELTGDPVYGAFGHPAVDDRYVFVPLYGDFGPSYSAAVDFAHPLSPVVLRGAGPYGENLQFYGDYAYGTGFNDVFGESEADFGEYNMFPSEAFIVSPRFGLYQGVVSWLVTARTAFPGPIEVGGNYVFTSGGEIIDVRDPLNPVYGTLLPEPILSRPFVHGERLYYIDHRGQVAGPGPNTAMRIYDATGLPGFEAVENPCSGAPLLVVLDALTAESVAGGVRVSWRTVSEVNHAGFRVLRGNSEATANVVSSWIPGNGSDLTGAEYEYVDRLDPSRRTLLYWIEDIDVAGHVTRHGPVTVDFGAPVTRSSGRAPAL